MTITKINFKKTVKNIKDKIESFKNKIKEEILSHYYSFFTKTISTFIFIPLLSTPLGIINTNVDKNEKDILCISSQTCNESILEEKKLIEIEKIRQYMKDRSMPLEKNAEDFVEMAYIYGLDYNLLPAIAVKESSGGKNVQYCQYNPFGWASCKIGFNSYRESIETVAKNLAGGNKKTAYYYANKDNKTKLYYYNGTIITGYEDEVLDIMKKIDSENIYK